MKIILILFFVMIRKVLLLLISCGSLLVTNTFAQPVITWQKSIGGSGLDFGKGLCVAGDSLSYYLTGYTNSANGDMTTNLGGTDIFLSKINLSGTVLWTRTFGTSADDYAHSVISSGDHGVIICGFTRDSVTQGTHGGFDVLLIKADSSGNQQWMKFYGGSRNDGDHFAEIIQTQDKGIVCITGAASFDGDLDTNYGSTDYWLFKTDSAGNLLWEKNFGGSDDEDGHNVLPMPDGGFIINGHTASNDVDVSGHHNPGSGIHDGWIVRVGPSGNIIWQKCIGGTGFELVNQMVMDDSGHIVMTGYTSSTDGDVSGNHGMNDVWIVTMDTLSGSLLSSEVYGGPGDDYGLYLLKQAGGSLKCGGYSNSSTGEVTGNHGNFDYWVFSPDQTGGIIWGNCYGGSSNDRIGGIMQSTENGIICYGYSNSSNGDVVGNHGLFDCWVFQIDCQEPSASFTCNPSPVCAGDTVVFSNLTTGALTCQWYINGVNYSNDFNAPAMVAVSGTDSVTLVTSFESCSDTAIQIIPVYSSPVVDLGPDTSICTGCSITLDAGNPGAEHWWSTGDSTQQITIFGADTVWVAVSVHGCSGYDTIVVAEDTVTGIGLKAPHNFDIAPNPNSGVFRINTNNTENYFVEVWSADGRCLLTAGPYFGNASVDLTAAGTGFYVAIIKNSERVVAKKKLLIY